ncbi:hypothetical protein [Micromonospora deserti]|nr:hypothetical protein [Micromonospora deserti]
MRDRVGKRTEPIDSERTYFDLPFYRGDRATPLVKAVYDVMDV